jgi:hypothetical protein
MPTVTIPPADYWRLRFLQERMEHAQTKGLLLQLREVQPHAAAFAALAQTYPVLATSEAWTLTDADTSLSAPDKETP